MEVRDILARKGHEVVAVGCEDTVLDAARKMNAARIGAVVVFEAERGVVGIFTDRYVLTRVVGECLPPERTMVCDVMTAPVTCCRPDTTLIECREVMTGKRLRHLPVVEDGQLVGIISTGDLLAQECERQQSTIDHLHAYLHNWS